MWEKGIILIVFLVTISGCQYNIDDSSSLFRTPQTYSADDGISITITPVKKISGYSVSRYLTAFYIEITNNSKTAIEFDPKDLLIVDQYNNQYNMLRPESVANIINENTRPLIYPRISIGIGTGYYGDHFGFWGNHHFWPYMDYPYFYDDYYYQDYYYQREKLEFVFSSTLIPGSVYPGATLSGFVYFNKQPKDVKNIKLHFNYSFRDSSKRKELTFDFTR